MDFASNLIQLFLVGSKLYVMSMAWLNWDNDSFTEGDICDASVIFRIKITFSSLSEEENNTATSFEFNGSI